MLELFPPGGENRYLSLFFPPHQRLSPFTSVDLTCPLLCARLENVIFKSDRGTEGVTGSRKRNVTRG